MEMEYEISFPQKEMAPYQKIKLTDSTCLKEKYKNQIAYQESAKDKNLFENSINKIKDLLELTHSVAHSNEVLCEKIIRATNNLNELEISNNDLLEVPELLPAISNLQRLSVCNGMLKSVPNTIGELQHLSILNLNHNQLQELPDCLSNLKNLELLDLSNNELITLPLSYAKLQKLKELNISNNQFQSLPKCVANGMGTLKVLNISNNPTAKINIIPYSIYLEKFYAKNNNKCSKFPDWILIPKFFNFKEFNFDGTQFDVFSLVRKEGNLNIKILSMTCSNLSSPVLEMMIENMTCLEKINVGNNDQYSPGNVFNCIPIHAFKNPAIITELNFRGTDLPTISSAIRQLRNLKKLDLGLNCITWFPDEFCELQELECLKIDGNDLIMFPEDIGNLKSLKVLRAENNSLLRLPKSFKNLKELEIIDMYDNIFQEFPNIFTEMTKLQGIDFEQNFCSTDNVKIGEISYSVLREKYMSSMQLCSDNSFNRIRGMKYQVINKSEDCDNEPYILTSYSDDEDKNTEENEKDNDDTRITESKTSDNDENWDTVTDSDDEFEPNNVKKVYYTGSSKQYIPQKSDGFCPSDLHSQRIKIEVASMCAYGSLPSFKIVQGQFDDA